MIGTRLGPFAILAKLGEGGMGEVYRARDTRLNRDVAIKILPASLSADPSARERLRREAIAAAGLDHPFICKVFEIGEAESRLFIVMELVAGETLHVVLARGPLAPTRVLALAMELTEALEIAHGRRIVHRDLKPSNIMLTAQHVKILDFGLAKVGVDPEAETRVQDDAPLTAPGAFVGTPAYMSPEQIAGDTVDLRSDIFSLGVVLAEALTGRHPFQRPTTAGIVAAVLNDPPLLQAAANTPLHPALRAVLLRMLAKLPAERYDTIGQVCADLRSLELLTLDTGPLAGAVPGAALQQRRRWPMVGRATERAELVAAMERALNEEGGIVLVGGEPGIGKTRLTEELLIEARRRGASPVIGHCYEMQGAPPYVPFVEMVEHTSRVVPREALRRLLGDAAPEVAKLLPELRQTFPDIPAAIALPPEQGRWYFFNAYKNFVERACQLAPIVAVFEDLHWADEPTLQLLMHLAAPAAAMPLLIVGTYRDVELDVTRPFAATLESLLRQRLAARVTLRRLPSSGVEALLSAMSGRPVSPSLSRLIFRETEGNPFFVEEVFQHLAEEGRLFDTAGGWREDFDSDAVNVPEGVRLVIGRRLERLSEATRKVLTTAAVIGRSFSLPLLEALEQSAVADATLDAIEQAERAGVVTPNAGHRETHYMFAHELIRQTLADTLSLPRRQRLHLRIATAMESLYASDRQKRAPALAHHFYQAGAGADPVRTTDYLTMAARQATAAAGHAEALTLLDNALALWEGDRSPAVAGVLMLRSLVLQSLARPDEAIAASAAAASIYRERGDYKSFATAMRDSARQRGWALDVPGALKDLDDAIAVISRETPASSVPLRLMRAHLLALRGDVREAAATMQQAETDLAGISDALLEAAACDTAARIAHHSGKLKSAVVLARQAIGLWRALGRPWEAIDCALMLSLEFFLGDAPARIEDYAAVLDEASRLGHHNFIWIMRCSHLLLNCGRHASAPGEIEELLAVASVRGVAFAHQAQLLLTLRDFFDGKSAAAVRTIRTIADAEPLTSMTTARAVLFFVLAHLDPAEARLTKTALPASLPAGDGPSAIGTWINLGYTVLGLEVLADRQAVAALDPVTRDVAVHADPHMVVLFPISLVCGITASAVGDWSRAEAHFVDARATTERLDLRVFGGRVLESHADMLMLRNHAGDRERAAALYCDAAAAYQRERIVPFAARLAARRSSILDAT